MKQSSEAVLFEVSDESEAHVPPLPGALAAASGSDESRPPDRHDRGKEILKSASLALSRRFNRHSRNSSAPPELSKLESVRSSLNSTRSPDASPHPSVKLDDAAHPPSEREEPRLHEATGRTGHAAAGPNAANWGGAWPHEIKRSWRGTKMARTPVPEFETLQAEVVVDGWEEVDPESLSRC
mmetsp:Transcript_16313/g.37277  ORF Transcript_16313/g.37277 Transcript_16313/m.37277 type:complete len:182 (-) Transcript_16313:313-858(-)